MIAAALRRAAARKPPRQRHQRGVEDRDQQDQDRRGDDRQHVGSSRRLAAGAERHRRDAEAEQQAAAVAHEDRRRIDVVDEKSAGRAEQNRQVARLGDRVRAGRAREQIDHQRRADDHRDAGAEAVHVVEQVERVGHAHDPHQREQHVERHRLQPVEAVVEEQQHGGERNLRDQLGRRLQRQDVVGEAGEEHRRCRRHQHRLRCGDAEDHAAREQHHRDGDAAEERHRTPVPAVFAWLGDEADAECDVTADRHDRQRERQRDGKRRGNRNQHAVGGAIVPARSRTSKAAVTAGSAGGRAIRASREATARSRPAPRAADRH